MRRLLVFLKPYWIASLAAPLLMILEVWMDLLQPRFMATIVDDGVMRGDLTVVLHTGGWMLLAAFVGLVGGVGCTFYAVRASMGFAADLRDTLFAKVQQFAFRNLDRFPGGTLVTRLTNDVMQLQNLVQMLLRMLIRSGFLFVGSLIMAFLISPKLSILFAVAVPILFLFFFVLLRRSVPLYRDAQAKLDTVNAVLQENLAGIRVVKAFVRAAFERTRFGRANAANYAVSLRVAKLISYNGPAMTLILNVSIVLILRLGGARTWNGSMEVGALAAFLTYATQTLNAAVSLGNTLVNISRARASADRVLEVLRTEPDMNDAAEDVAARPAAMSEAISSATGEAEDDALEAAAAGRIRFENVSFAYDAEAGGGYALKDISFEAAPGQTIGILGATGAGKSTLVSLIPRLYDVTRGRILVDGADVRDMPADRLRRRVGIVLQQAVLFSGTILDNIRYARPDASREEAEAAARAAEAHDFIAAFPEGYDTVVGQRGLSLSGGQKQRISIARTLLANPAVLILDDSTSAVDLRTEARIREALRRRSAGATRIVIAQRISSVADADRILVLEDGRLVADGTHRELLRASPIYRDIYESQAGREEENAHA